MKTLTAIIQENELDLENNYFVFVDKITEGNFLMNKDYRIVESTVMYNDIVLLYKKYRHAFILNKSSNIEELEKELEERREFFSKKIYLKDLKFFYLRNEKSLKRIIEKTEVIIGNSNTIDKKFLDFDYNFFKSNGNFELDMKRVMNIVYEINRNFEKSEVLLAFFVLMASIRAFENIPEEIAYKDEYEYRVKNSPIEQVNNELIEFILKVQDKGTQKKFLFDGEEQIYIQDDIRFGINNRNEIYIKNTMKIDTDTADFEYFFVGEQGFIKREDEVERQYKAFKMGDEVVKNKIYDNFETVDHYFV